MTTRQIGADLFEVQPLPALRSFLLQPRIAPAIAEALAVLGGGDVGDLDVSRLGPAVAGFFGKLPPAELEAILRELLSTAMVSTGAGGMVPLMPIFDVKMRGRTVDTWRLVAFAIEVNYPDFFALLAASAVKRAAAESPSGE